MKVPEKIHIQPNAHDRWFEGDIPNCLPDGLFVEYIRKDAFIEKAKKWLYLQLNEINMEGEDMENFLKYFKEYMEEN